MLVFVCLPEGNPSRNPYRLLIEKSHKTNDIVSMFLATDSQFFQQKSLIQIPHQRSLPPCYPQKKRHIKNSPKAPAAQEAQWVAPNSSV
jgi:hypothetical protein